jgi:hypothetical protein
VRGEKHVPIDVFVDTHEIPDISLNRSPEWKDRKIKISIQKELEYVLKADENSWSLEL